MKYRKYITFEDAMRNLLSFTKGKDVVYTHGGMFHADDVMSAALLRIAGYKGEIKRVFTISKGVSDHSHLIFDIGMGRFDHHQDEAHKRRRENGVKYAAFGLLVEACGLLNVSGFGDFDRLFVEIFDKKDNAQLAEGEDSNISLAITKMNPLWNKEITSDEAFEEAVLFAKRILEREFKCRKAIIEGQRVVNEAINKSEGSVLILPYFINGWVKTLNHHPKNEQFISAVFPSIRGGYNVQLIPGVERYTTRGHFTFDTKDKPEGCTFVHPSGFMAATEKLETAVEIAKTMVEAEIPE